MVMDPEGPLVHPLAYLHFVGEIFEENSNTALRLCSFK